MPATYSQIIVTGDSIAQASFGIGGYGLALAAEYSGKLDVVNRGMGGYNSRQLLHKLRTDFQVPAGGEVVLFLVHIGSNDCVLDGAQIVPIDEFRSNLSAIISHIQSRFPKAGIILLTPSIFDEEATNAMFASVGITNAPNERSDANAKLYADVCVEVGKVEGVPVVNAYEIHRTMVNGGVESWRLIPDGLHFSPKAYAPLTQSILDTINNSLPALKSANLPEAFDFFLTYGAGTPAGNDHEGIKKTQAVFASFGPDIRERLGAYVKKRSEEA